MVIARARATSSRHIASANCANDIGQEICCVRTNDNCSDRSRASCQPPGGLYLIDRAFSSAASVSSTVTNGVV